jgi:nucleoprotein TPR
MELLLRKNRDVEAALAEKESQFVQEMTAKSRLADLYKEGMEEATMRLEETEALLQAAQSTSGTVEARIRQARSEYEREIETLHSQLLNRDQEVNSGEGGRTGNRMLLADVYAEYAKTKGDLLQANQEIDRLKGCIQDICQDLEARVPVLQMERRDNERLKADISALSTQLLEASRARDELGARVRRSEDEARDAIKIHSSLEQQVKDLSKQIQALLGEMEGVVPPNDGVMDADQVIDERLVVFRNIQELQVRNQELVRVLRELSQQHETAELERLKQTEAEMRSVLEANVAELAELRETRQRQTTLLESLIRQRDMLRSMLEDKVSGAPSGVAQQEMASVLRPGTPAISASQDFASLAEVKAEYDMFKSEKAESERYLMGQLEQARTETSEMRSRHAQLTAQLAFGEERYALLKQNYEMERAELASLRKSNSSALESIMKHQTQVQQLMSELMATKETQQRVSSQLSSLRVELDMVRSSERRLITDLTCSQQEKERLTQLLAGLQALATEHESSDADLKQRLGQQIEFLERELHSARMKVVEEVEAHKLAVASADREYRELVRRYDQLVGNEGE